MIMGEEDIKKIVHSDDEGSTGGVSLDEQDEGEEAKAKGGCYEASDHMSSKSGGDRKSDTNDESAETIREQLTKKESVNIFRLRVLVIMVLVAAAIVISIVVYRLLKQGQLDEFESQFEGAAEKVIESFDDIMTRMGSVSALGTYFTSYADDHKGEIDWPFVTLNNFEHKASHTRYLSGALMVGMSPLVTKDEFAAWDDYVSLPEQHTWIHDTIAYQGRLGVDDMESETSIAKTTLTDRTVDVMHYFDDQGNAILEEGDNNQSTFFPRWQTSPYLREGIVNENLNRDENSTDILEYVLESGTAVLGGYRLAPPGRIDSPDPTTALFAALRSINHGVDTPYLGDPMANLYVPVFDTFDEAKRKVIGVVSALIHWQAYFEKILPPSVPGVVVVLDYECGQTGFIHDHASVTGHDHPRRQRRRRQRRARTTTTRDLVLFTVIDDSNGTKSKQQSNGNATTDVVAVGGDDAHELGTEHVNAHNEETEDEDYSGETSGHDDHDDEHNNHNEENHDEEEDDEHNHNHHDDKDNENHHEGEDDHSTRFTYLLNGAQADVVGFGDLHDPKFQDWMREAHLHHPTLEDGSVMGIPVDQRCSYHMHVFPTLEFFDQYNTNQPIIIATIIASVFGFAIVVFILYNHMVERRQRLIVKKASQSAAILSSLFPKNVRDRLMEQEETLHKKQTGTKARLKGFISGESDDGDATTAPIADLFPHCTVLFADIAGFTAWSSAREPSQVFILLQSLYGAMDQLAKLRRVFKVETIGDCYMAVTGLPDPQDSHASIMVRFAWDCLVKMAEVTKKLESSLGPDTTELSVRIGLHSGPVTAGVLRGDRARFQLFGDTVNTASRMESTGVPGKIQVSGATARLLKASGKEQWLMMREDAVKAKGKGVMQTFWVNPTKRYTSSSSGSATSDRVGDEAGTEEVHATQGTLLPPAKLRLIDWIVKLMLDDIKKIIHFRKGDKASKTAPTYKAPEGTMCLDEVKEVIHMPKFDSKKSLLHSSREYKTIEINGDIISDLGAYVAAIASLYRDNPFHNFDHACHVTMSVTKLLRRIVSPELLPTDNEGQECSHKAAMHLHDYTYGINSDPLAMFAMTFSALIHDVDHRGVSNVQLAAEAPEMARMYDRKSIAEQNSLDIAWDILMEDRFAKLRAFLFVSKAELLRFRQLIVNVVLATDIFDKELNDLRKNRWTRAFSGEPLEDNVQHSDLRATIVIEHIIQASDVSHTMQHWHIYQKWNKCLFKEMYAAYKQGRLGKDPASFWYKGEIGFFDNYIIPLAKKLKDCGVFGVSSDEYLNYAQCNRVEWEDRGQEIVAKMVEECEALYGENNSSMDNAVVNGSNEDKEGADGGKSRAVPSNAGMSRTSSKFALQQNGGGH